MDRARAPKERFLAVAIAIFVAAAVSSPVAAEISGKSGDVGSITVPIANNSLSFSADNVRITVSAPPGLDLQILGTSQLGPLAVSPGTTAVFLINYEIGPKAVDGNYELRIHPTYDGALTYIQQPTLDTNVQFSIKGPPTPTVTITAEYDNLFDRLQGKALNTPTSRASNATVFIHDYNSDIDVNSIVLPGTNVVTSSDPRDRVIQISGLVSGNTYAFSVKNAAGGVTQGSWRVENLALVVNSASASFNEAADGFSGSIAINANSTASGGAEKIIEYNPTTQTKITDRGVGPFTVDISASRPNNEVQSFYSLRDTEGNSASQNLAVYEWNYSFPVESGQTLSNIRVTGNESVTKAGTVPVVVEN